MKTKLVLGVIILLLIAAAASLWFRRQAAPSSRQPEPVAKTSTSTPVVQHNVDTAQLPEQFPSDIPLEQGAKITLNYNAVNAKGMYQASREFISAKSLDQNFEFYQRVLKQNGWMITQTLDDPTRHQKIILATKGANNLNIRVYLDSGVTKVSINNETQP